MAYVIFMRVTIFVYLVPDIWIIPFFIELVNEDIGFQYGKSATFPDVSLATSFNQFDEDHANPRDGRLYKPWKFWCADDIFAPSYLELILVQKYYVFAVSVQVKTLTSNEAFTINFTILYSDNYAHWTHYNSQFKVSYGYGLIVSIVNF